MIVANICLIAKQINMYYGFRPPPNLLRQEIEGTRIYLTILNRTITEYEPSSNQSTVEEKPGEEQANGYASVSKSEESQLRETAEQRLVSFCMHTLKEAATSQASVGEALGTDLFFAATLRSPVVVKVILENL